MDKSWIRWLRRPIKRWRKPLQVAVENRDVQEIISLKKSGADFSVKTKKGQSMLHVLAKASDGLKENEEEIFDLLINERCIDVNATDEDGMSALQLAIVSGNDSIALKLIDHGANVNCIDKNMTTPLHDAVFLEAYEVVELLLSRGANVNAKGYMGWRPIHCARSEKCLDILVNYGAQVDAQGQAGYTALAMSISIGSFYCAKILCMYGADVANDIAALRAATKLDYKMLLASDLGFNFAINHLAELAAADLLYPSTFLLDALKNNSDVSKSFRDRVEKLNCEAVWLKLTHFDERATVYDILHMNPNERSRFICGCWEEWQKFCRQLEFDHHLSHFYRVIVACGYQARARRRLLKSAKEAWLELTDIPLPDLCVDRILSHLSNYELLRMADGDES